MLMRNVPSAFLSARGATPPLARRLRASLGPQALAFMLTLTGVSPAYGQGSPNVVIIYGDDLGYGDVSAYGANRLKTPNIDGLARDGMRFTDAHSTAATCTPSRYSLLTGDYAFRREGARILPGDAALLIDTGRTTLPRMFQQAGFATGVVGKWHLGLGPEGGPDWNGEVKPGPLDVGFDYSFIMAATGDRVPTVFVENRRVVGLDPADPITVSYQKPVGDWPTGRANPELLRVKPSHGHDMTIVNGISRIGYMTGGKAALWKDEDMADVFTRKAVSFIEQHRAKPFFLYFALHDPHVPRVPHPRFVGATPLGPRGDAIAQADWCVGEIIATLDRLKLANDTLVLFTSDNGPVVDDGYQDQAVEKLGDHKPSGPFRGGKYSIFEAGTRVPFIIRWPGRIKPGTSDALISQVDLLASFAALVGKPLAGAATSDSENMLPALLGTSKQGRTLLVEQAGTLALRQGALKYIAPDKGDRINKNTNIELGNAPSPQLYDLAVDPGELRNLAAERPEKVRELAALLDKIQARQQVRRDYSIPIVDISAEQSRQVIVDRESGQYLGHPATALLEDGRTMIVVYPKGHGKGAIVMKRSTDGGRTWSERLPVPDNWATSQETPTIHRVVDADGIRRLILFSGLFPVRMSMSADDGITWTPLEPAGDFGGIVAMASVVELRTGKGHYLAMFHDDGRFFRGEGKRTPEMTLYQIFSRDGGLTWSAPEEVFASADVHLCEPGVVRSPDGRQLAALLRENRRVRNSHVIFSNDEGRTWTAPRELPGALTGDRHTARYAPDGRLFVSFRDTTLESPTRGDWVGWVGRYDDIVNGREGDFRVRLMDNTRAEDCCYPGVERLPDGTLVTTTYGHWTAGEAPYIVSVRFRMDELDAKRREP
jgi:arylsulfatase A-like enzyme